MAFHRRLFARSEWHHPWLWDFGATLAVLDALFAPALVRGQGPADLEGLIVAGTVVVTYCLVIGAFTAMDRRFAQALPAFADRDDGGRLQLVQIPALVVFLYLGVLIVADLTVWHEPTVLPTTLVFVAANAAAIAGCSLFLATRAEEQ